ncbi:MAG: FmdB family transcriptional regulator [Modestobacter sp.]|nr:FmdB family transcriptional regulator [Modestobacter sp.]
MPTYQYRCTECGNDLEAVQKFTDPALTECPTCHGSLRKVFNAVGVVFKGSGFYRTDSRKAESSATPAASKESSTSSGSKDSSSSGSKDSSSSSSSSSTGSGTGGSSTGSSTGGKAAN